MAEDFLVNIRLGDALVDDIGKVKQAIEDLNRVATGPDRAIATPQQPNVATPAAVLGINTSSTVAPRPQDLAAYETLIRDELVRLAVSSENLTVGSQKYVKRLVDINAQVENAFILLTQTLSVKGGDIMAYQGKVQDVFHGPEGQGLRPATDPAVYSGVTAENYFRAQYGYLPPIPKGTKAPAPEPSYPGYSPNDPTHALMSQIRADSAAADTEQAEAIKEDTVAAKDETQAVKKRTQTRKQNQKKITEAEEKEKQDMLEALKLMGSALGNAADRIATGGAAPELENFVQNPDGSYSRRTPLPPANERDQLEKLSQGRDQLAINARRKLAELDAQQAAARSAEAAKALEASQSTGFISPSLLASGTQRAAALEEARAAKAIQERSIKEFLEEKEADRQRAAAAEAERALRGVATPAVVASVPTGPTFPYVKQRDIPPTPPAFSGLTPGASAFINPSQWNQAALKAAELEAERQATIEAAAKSGLEADAQLRAAAKAAETAAKAAKTPAGESTKALRAVFDKSAKDGTKTVKTAQEKFADDLRLALSAYNEAQRELDKLLGTTSAPAVSLQSVGANSLDQLRGKTAALSAQVGYINTSNNTDPYGGRAQAFNRGTAANINADAAGIIAANEDLRKSILAEATAHTELAALEAQDKIGSDEWIKAKIALTRASEDLKQKLVEARLLEDGQTQAQKELQDARQKVAGVLAKQAEIIDATGALTPQGKADLTAEAQSQINAQRINVQKELLGLELRSVKDIQDAAIIARTRKTAQLELETAEFNELKNNKEYQEARSLRIIAEREYNAAQRKTNAEIAQQQGYGGSSLFARFLGRFGSGSTGGGGSGGPGGGFPPELTEFFSHGLANISRYAIPGGLAFGAIGQIKGAVTEAETLEKSFANIRGQFDATFGSASGPAFDNFKKNILDISKATGVTATDLATIGGQLQGAFGQDQTIKNSQSGVSQTGQVLVKDQIQAAAEIEKVTGLSATEITNSLTAASIEFGVSFRRIADVTLALQDRTGVQAKELLPLVADIAPAAKSAGYSLEQVLSIAALVQQKSGQAGGAIAQAFVRLLPQIDSARGKLLALAETNDVSSDYIKKIATGNASDIIAAVAKDYNRLGQGFKDAVEPLIGGKRDAGAIVAAFTDPRLAEITKTAEGAPDLLASRFKAVSDSLTEQIAKLQESFRQLVVQVYDGGLGDALKKLVEAFSLVVDIISAAFKAFNAIDDATGGWAKNILELAAAYVILSKAIGAISGSSLAGGLAGLLGRGAGGAAVAGGTGLEVGEVLGGGVFSGAAGAAGGSAAGSLAAGGIGAKLAGLFGAEGVGGTSAAGFASLGVAIPLAIAGVAALITKHVGDGIAKDITKKKDAYAKATDEFLAGELGKTGDPNTFKAGLAVIGGTGGKDAHRSDAALALIELNKRQFAKDGSYYANTVGGVGSNSNLGGGADEIIAALQDDAVAASVGKALSSGSVLKTQTVPAGRGQSRKIQVETNPVLVGLKKTLGKSYEDFFTALTKGSIEEQQAALVSLVEQAKSGDHPEAVQALLLLGSISPEVKAAIASAQAESAKTKADADRATAVLKADNDYATIKAQFEAGDLSITEYFKAAAEHQKFLDSVVAADPNSAEGQKAAQDSATVSKNAEAARSKALRSQTDLQDKFDRVSLGNTDATDKSQVDNLTRLLDNPDFKDPAARFKAAEDILTILGKLKAATTIPREVRVEQALTVLQDKGPNANLAWAAFLDQYATLFGEQLDSTTRDLFVALLLGETTKEAVTNEILKRKAGLGNIGASNLDPEIGVGVGKNPSAEFGKMIDELFTKIPAFAAGVPDKTSGQKTADMADRIRKAHQDYLKSLIEGDPVKLAQQELDNANETLAEASDDAERWTALAAQVRANRKLESAKFDVSKAMNAYEVSLAEFRGDSLKAAQLQLQEAIRERDRIVALNGSGAGQVDVESASQAVLTAQAKVRDEQLNTGKDHAQFLFDMGQITKSQLVDALTKLKQIPDLTQKQLDDLDLQIKRLNNELGGSLQFNLPSKFALPTYYEARRIGQVGNSGAAYADNRNINITIAVNDGTGQQQMLQVLNDVLGAPARISTATQKKY